MSVTDTKQEIVTILREADSLLKEPQAWTRLALCRDEDKKPVLVNDPAAHSFCLSGSVLRAGLDRKSPDSTVHTALNVLSKLCRILYGKGVQKYGTEDDFNDFKRFPLAYTNDGLIKSHLEARKILQDAIQSLSKKSVSEMSDEDDDDTKKDAEAEQPAATPEGGAAPPKSTTRSEAPTMVAEEALPDPNDGDFTTEADEDDDEEEDEDEEMNIEHPSDDNDTSSPPEEQSTVMNMSKQPVELHLPTPGEDEDEGDISMPDLDMDLMEHDQEEEEDK